MTTLFTIVALAGVVNILTRSYLLQPLRDRLPSTKIKYMANCPQCTGMWVGALYYLAFVCDYNSLSNCFAVILWGGIVSLCADVLVTLLDVCQFAKSALLRFTTLNGDQQPES